MTRPLTSICATPGRFSNALTIVWSVSEVSSRRPTDGDSTASETTGCSFSLSARITSGSLTSRGKLGRTIAILSRTSCIARVMSVSSRNSANTVRDALVRVAADQLDAGDLVERVLERLGDVGLDRLRRRARVVRQHEHERQRDLGHLLDLEPLVAEDARARRCATITIVAKTGLLIETRVIHMDSDEKRVDSPMTDASACSFRRRQHRAPRGAWRHARKGTNNECRATAARCASPRARAAAATSRSTMRPAPSRSPARLPSGCRSAPRAPAAFGGSAVLISTTPASSSRRPSEHDPAHELAVVDRPHEASARPRCAPPSSGSVGVGRDLPRARCGRSRTCRCAASSSALGNADVDVESRACRARSTD